MLRHAEFLTLNIFYQSNKQIKSSLPQITVCNHDKYYFLSYKTG